MGDVCQIRKGKHYPKTNNPQFWNGSYPWLTIGDIEKQISTTSKTLTQKGVETVSDYQSYVFKRDTFVVACYGATLAKVGWLNGNFYSSTNLINLDSGNRVTNKYLFYWFLKNQEQIKQLGVGSVIAGLSLKDLKKVEILLPSFQEQKQIINIIEPIEKLFFKFPRCIKIDTFSNTRKNVKNLINIIEPIETFQKLIRKIKAIVKKILILNYKLKEGKLISLDKFIFNNCLQHTNQSKYLATNAIKELSVDFEKIIDLNKAKKPSRANVVVKNNSILFSKLIGENKLIPIFQWNKDLVFSTGMYCVSSSNNDHLLGFLLSSDFQKQKEIYAVGTTITAINNQALSEIKIKSIKGSIFKNKFTIFLSSLIYLQTKIEKLIIIFANLLIQD